LINEIVLAEEWNAKNQFVFGQLPIGQKATKSFLPKFPGNQFFKQK